MNTSKLLFIVGPTASGKTDLAVEAAERAGNTEIINCDSVQFFQGVDIGAAKPDEALLKRVRHHLIGNVPLGGAFTAGDFCREALGVIESGAERGVLKFISVGGSGFYVQALEKGMYDVPEVPEEVRTQLEIEAEDAIGLERLYQELSKRDPESAARISARDRYRIVRALGILRSHPSGETLSELKRRFAESVTERPFLSRKIGLFIEREKLRRRVRVRVQRMLRSGLIDEVEALRAKGLRDWSPLGSVGYREVQALLDGKIAASELEEAMITSTMQLAKKQMTWFKRDETIQWFDAEEWERVLEAAQRALNS